MCGREGGQVNFHFQGHSGPHCGGSNNESARPLIAERLLHSVIV